MESLEKIQSIFMDPFATRFETEAESDLRLDMDVLCPPSKGPSMNSIMPRSKVELFTEILESPNGSSRKLVEKILLHPLSQAYLNLKWAQCQKFYYLLVVMMHVVYSIGKSNF